MNQHTTPLSGLRRDTVSSAPKGLDLIRSGIALAVCDGISASAAKYAASRWGENSRAAMLTKADIPAFGTIQGSGAAVTAGTSGATAVAEFVDLVRAASIIGRLPLRRVPFRTPMLVMDEGPATDWRDEGAAYKNTSLKVTRSDALEPFDLGAMLVGTNEMLRDPSLNVEMMIRDQLVKALAAKLDADFIDPANTGSGGVKPASIAAAADQNSPQEGLFESADIFTGDPNNSWIVMNPWRAARLYGAARPDIGMRGGSLNGVPVITSAAVPEEVLVLLDPDAIALALGGADVRSSTQASISMEDGPSMTSATSVAQESTSSMFQLNSTAIIGSVQANWKVLRPEAVVYYFAPALGL